MTLLKYEIRAEKNYRKQYKLLQRRGYNMELLDDVVLKLAKGETLSAKYRDHPLQGNMYGYRDCHIQGDWVLIYKIDKGILTLILAGTGTHSDLLE
jgi:mRNA interferase YafQ